MSKRENDPKHPRASVAGGQAHPAGDHVRLIAFLCPHCQTTLTIKKKFAGKTAPCPYCKQPLRVPVHGSREVPAATGGPVQDGDEDVDLDDVPASSAHHPRTLQPHEDAGGKPSSSPDEQTQSQTSSSVPLVTEIQVLTLAVAAQQRELASLGTVLDRLAERLDALTTPQPAPDLTALEKCLNRMTTFLPSVETVQAQSKTLSRLESAIETLNASVAFLQGNLIERFADLQTRLDDIQGESSDRAALDKEREAAVPRPLETASGEGPQVNTAEASKSPASDRPLPDSARGLAAPSGSLAATPVRSEEKTATAPEFPPKSADPLLAFAVFQNCQALQTSAESLANKCQVGWHEAARELSVLQKRLCKLEADFRTLPQTGTEEERRQQLEKLVPTWANGSIPVLRELDELHSGKNDKGEELAALRDSGLRLQLREVRNQLFGFIKEYGGWEEYPVKPGDPAVEHVRWIDLVGTHTRVEGFATIRGVLHPGYRRKSDGYVAKKPRVFLSG